MLLRRGELLEAYGRGQSRRAASDHDDVVLHYFALFFLAHTVLMRIIEAIAAAGAGTA
jgi:hypothetical protein